MAYVPEVQKKKKSLVMLYPVVFENYVSHFHMEAGTLMTYNRFY